MIRNTEDIVGRKSVLLRLISDVDLDQHRRGLIESNPGVRETHAIERVEQGDGRGDSLDRPALYVPDEVPDDVSRQVSFDALAEPLGAILPEDPLPGSIEFFDGRVRPSLRHREERDAIRVST